jgi:hypothetical protein
MWLFSNKRYQHTTYKIVYVIVHGMAAVSLEFDTLLGVMWRFASFQIANALLLSSSLLALCLSNVAFIPCRPLSHSGGLHFSASLPLVASRF